MQRCDPLSVGSIRRLQELVGLSLLVGGNCLLEDEQIRPRRPTVVVPKRCAQLIVAEEKDVAFGDASVMQSLETPVEQSAAIP
jgi:hypothetical protein